LQSSRRAARELALKVLFELELGKRPLSELEAGALEQIRSTLDSEFNQIALNAHAALNATTSDWISAEGEELSMKSRRRIRTLATAMAKEVRALAISMSGILAGLTRDASEGSSEAAIEESHRAAEAARAATDRLANRETSHETTVRALASAAAEHTILMEEAMAENAEPVRTTAEYTLRVLRGVLEHLEDIDRRVAARVKDWPLERIAVVDKNVLRIAAYEIQYMSDIPAATSIDQAVKLAKKYSTAESGRFINGVLGGMVEESGSVPVNAGHEPTGQEALIER
jgi:N utilization substance protein B